MQITVAIFFWQIYMIILRFYIILRRGNRIQFAIYSRVAQWKRAGPITQRSVDRNHALLKLFRFFTLPTYHILLEIIIFGICYFNMCIYFCQAERLCKLQLTSFFDKCVWLYWDFTLYWRVKIIIWGLNSRVAQWKRAGPITQRSVDRNHALLILYLSLPTYHILL